MSSVFSKHSIFFLLVVLMMCLCGGAAAAGRQLPALEKEWLGHEGTVLIPGIGRYMIGSHKKPSIHGLDKSGPAAAHARYLPGGDDTFVPNPGYEVPNPHP